MSEEDFSEATPSSEEDAPALSGRVPHLGHALLLFAIAGLLLLLAQAILLLPKMPAGSSPVAISLQHPKLLLAAEGGTYALTLTLAWFLFPLLWRRSFASGLDWNGATALSRATKLVPLGLVAGWTVQGLSSLIAMPKSIPMDSFFRSPSDVWIVTVFGTLLAPLFEEVCFRGFLLPACAIAWDWLLPTLRYLLRFSAARLEGSEPAREVMPFRDEPYTGTGNMAHRSVPAVVVSSIATSILFGMMHAQQLGYTWAAVVLLSCVSLLLTAVRLRTRSVACSTLVHGSYNLSVFLTLFIATGGYRHLERMAR